MIVRAWRGRARASNPGAYVEHFKRNVLPELRTIEGFLGASLLRQNRPDDVEFLVLTRWSSIEAIRGFAGDDVRKAVVEPEAVAALASFDATVQHYEVVEEVVNR
jgi:heme-degrading monooxygenase HmoA